MRVVQPWFEKGGRGLEICLHCPSLASLEFTDLLWPLPIVLRSSPSLPSFRFPTLVISQNVCRYVDEGALGTRHFRVALYPRLAHVEAVNDLLRSVAFHTTSKDLAVTTRSVSFTLNDGSWEVRAALGWGVGWAALGWGVGWGVGFLERVC